MSGYSQNAAIENAGRLLTQVQSEKAIFPLIHALQTTHKYATGNQAGRTQAGTVNGNVQGLDTGNKPTHVSKTSSNQAVASALRSITG